MLDLDTQFCTACEKLTGEITPENRLGIAVSGGPDSLALLLLAHNAFPGAIAAVTVNHQLRPEAADEAETTSAICTARGIPHDTLVPDDPITGNLQSSARIARYTLIDKWRKANAIAWVATAHHADDQLETLLMRMMRGSGIDGLSAIRPVNGHIVRPLLGFRKADLEEYLAGKNIVPAYDLSNDDRAFDRVRLRQLLADFPDYTPERLGRTIKSFSDAGEALEWAARRECDSVVLRDGDTVTLSKIDYPAEILRRIVLICLTSLDTGIEVRGYALERFIEALKSGETAMLGNILVRSVAKNDQSYWKFTPAPPRKTR